MKGPVEGTVQTLAADAPAPRTVFRDVFAVPEFRALWLAQILSVGGDQLARVALTVLVYDRTTSPLLAAVTYAASFVPSFVGGVTLSALADRNPRRAVMIVCDLVRAAMVLVMAIPGVPIAALIVLLCAVTLVGAPFTSARAAVYPDVLPGDRYVLGTAVTLTTTQLAQVIGFAVGGTLVGLLGVGPSLVADAVTFVASALIVRLWTQWRPRPARGFATGPAAWAAREFAAQRTRHRPPQSPRPRPRQAGANAVSTAWWPGSGWCSAAPRCGIRCCSAGCARSTTRRRGSRSRWPGRSAAGRSRLA